MNHNVPQESIRLLIADDHTVVREGLVALLSDELDLVVVAEAGTGAEALKLARRHRPDVALIDITMPDMSGLEATREITADLPDVKILILTMHDEEAFFFEALQAGADGYILKGAHSDELRNAIRAVYEGGVYLSPKLAGELVREVAPRRPAPAPQDDPLTPREREVLSLIARGLTNRDIAERLTLSINTIKTHRLHIYRKLDLHDRAALVRYALQHGMLREDG